MSVHACHPPIREHGLADNCARCAEHAETPFETLDDANLRALCKRTQGWMRDEPDAFPRSDTEAKAMRTIELIIACARRSGEVGITL